MRKYAWVSTAVALLLTACGGGLSGEYGDKDTTVLTFKPGGKVELDFVGIHEGSYRVEDGRVYISFNGRTEIMPIDSQGCLEGGGMWGKLCKR